MVFQAGTPGPWDDEHSGGDQGMVNIMVGQPASFRDCHLGKVQL